MERPGIEPSTLLLQRSARPFLAHVPQSEVGELNAMYWYIRPALKPSRTLPRGAYDLNLLTCQMGVAGFGPAPYRLKGEYATINTTHPQYYYVEFVFTFKSV